MKTERRGTGTIRAAIDEICARIGKTIQTATLDDVCSRTRLPRDQIRRAFYAMRGQERRNGGGVKRRGRRPVVRPGSGVAKLFGLDEQQLNGPNLDEQRLESLAQLIGISRSEQLLRELRSKLEARVSQP
jgi:hypothetical protein